MIRAGIGLWCSAVLTAALYTGAAAGGRFFTSMTGFLLPHYGYSAYAISALVFLAPWAWLRWVALAALLASGNRASWVGVIVGWASTGGPRRAALAGALGVLAVVGGYAWKPRTDNDSVRIQIWRATMHQIGKHPAGLGRGGLCLGVDGNAITHAHSDVLEIAALYGVKVAVWAVVLVVFGLLALPAGPEKAALVGLTAISVIDNRLTTSWACLGLWAALWIAALRKPRLALRER